MELTCTRAHDASGVTWYWEQGKALHVRYNIALILHTFVQLIRELCLVEGEVRGEVVRVIPHVTCWVITWANVTVGSIVVPDEVAVPDKCPPTDMALKIRS